MASTGKCEFCGSTLLSSERACSHCGAANPNYVEDAPKTIFLPKTIDELKEYCAERGMPLLRMRFFIGEDFKEPMAFGIYRDQDSFVVYKNKRDGSRAVRYHGPDEAYAVKEILTKLLEECHNRGIYPDGAPASRTRYTGEAARQQKKKRSDRFWCIVGILFVLFFLFWQISNYRTNGYYRASNGRLYYRYNSSWYYDRGYDDWVSTYSFPDANYSDYYLGRDYDSDWGGSDFRRSEIWEDLQERHSSSSSSDYDSWDSSDTDWDSDW